MENRSSKLIKFTKACLQQVAHLPAYSSKFSLRDYTLQQHIVHSQMHAYWQAIMSIFHHEVKHEKGLSFKHRIMIENFFRCKKRFPRFHKTHSARTYITHWVSMYNERKIEILEMIIIL